MILFRCNAGPEIGFGHLTRCRALAHALVKQGQCCVMVGPEPVYATSEDQKLFHAWEPLAWDGVETDATTLVQVARLHEADTLVLDDYRVNEAYQLILRAKGLKWLQFEARTDRPIWADIVLNANPAATPEDYASALRTPKTSLLLGPRYAVLRREFSEVKPRDPNRPVRKVLVTFGGGDDRGAIIKVLSALLPCVSSDIHFVVISGAHNPANASLSEWIGANARRRATLVINPPRISRQFQECDLAVMAGGTATYEAARCGLPMILLAIAQNQLAQAKAWQNHGAALFLGELAEVKPTDLCGAFNALSNPETYPALSLAARTLVDGHGAERVAHALGAENILGNRLAEQGGSNAEV